MAHPSSSQRLDAVPVSEAAERGVDEGEDCIPGTRYSRYFVLHLMAELSTYLHDVRQRVPDGQDESIDFSLAERLDVLAQMSSSSPAVVAYLLSPELRSPFLYLIAAIADAGPESTHLGLARPFFSTLVSISECPMDCGEEESIDPAARGATSEAGNGEDFWPSALDGCFRAMRWMDARVMLSCVKVMTNQLTHAKSSAGLKGSIVAQMSEEEETASVLNFALENAVSEELIDAIKMLIDAAASFSPK